MSLLHKSILDKFEECIKTICQQSARNQLYIQFGKKLDPSKLLKNIDKLHPRNFIWEDRKPGAPEYTEKEKLSILKKLTHAQKIFIATAVSKGTKDMTRFSFRGKMILDGKATYRGAQLGSIALKSKNGRGVFMKAGIIHQIKTNFTPLLRSIRPTFEMEPGPMLKKLKDENIKMFVRILDKKLIALETRQWFKDLSLEDKKKYINDTVIKNLEISFNESKKTVRDCYNRMMDEYSAKLY